MKFAANLNLKGPQFFLLTLYNTRNFYSLDNCLKIVAVIIVKTKIRLLRVASIIRQNDLHVLTMQNTKRLTQKNIVGI